MRKPKQVLVFLYRKNKEYEYCIFYRNKNNICQALSGGVEDNETLKDTVKREIFEETGIKVNKIYQLSSIASIPVINITGEFTWEDTYVVIEYSFGVPIENVEIKLSNEHKKYEWLPYNEAYKELTFDSNKTALWELNERLLKSKLN